MNLPAAQVVIGMGIPLWQIPGMHLVRLQVELSMLLFYYDDTDGNLLCTDVLGVRMPYK